jgi:cytidine deaminase
MIQSSLSPAYQKLLQSADGARANAYTPNSHFNVGAAVLTSTGEVFTGCNMEQTSFADHAEQVAIGNALAAGHSDIVALAIATKSGSMGSACGNCRQVMEDLNPGITEIYRDDKGEVHLHSAKQELPAAYHRDHPADPVALPPAQVDDPLLQEAYIARSHSVTTRSHYPVGAAVQTADGHIFRGVQLEASSFAAPASRLAVGNALSQGEKPSDIQRIALVGGPSGTGELPKTLSWDALEAMDGIAPQATVVFPGVDGKTTEEPMAQFLADRFQAALHPKATPTP